jgi:tRNA(Leu) C34 or U34 (ribose-2'-O)-methylase TrmL
VSRASAGGLEHVKVARIGNVAQAIESLKSRGLWVVGFDAAGTERWDAVDYRRPVVLVLGGEGRGMRRLVRERCDHLVALPLFGHVGSLNVSVAAGIALYEVVRQRGAVPSQVRPIPVRSAEDGRQIVGPGPEDREEDPGHSRAPVERLAGDDAVDGGEESDEPRPRFIRVHEEEAAWAGPPQILKAAPYRSHHGGDRPQGPRGPHGRRGRRFGKGRGRPAGEPGRPAPPPPAQHSHAPRPAEGPPPTKAGPARRRRRRRGRREHPPQGPHGPTQPRPLDPPPQGPPPDPQSSGSAPPPGGPEPHRRRGRRRRR